MNTDPSPPAPPAWTAYALLGAIALALFAVRLTGPSDLMDNDQERPAAYVLDVVNHGHWLCQRDATGDITSKPPLYTWLAALATIPAGRIHRLTLDLPSALATLLLSWLIFRAGQTHFGWRTGWLGALAFLLSGVALKAVGLARTDALFALGVAAAALAAFAAWSRGRGWIWFWLAAAVATLTKGPLGVVLAAAGLLAALWERRSGSRLPLRGSHAVGLLLFALLTGGWFALAYREMGPPLVDKMISRELLGHIAAANSPATLTAEHFGKPFLYFLLRFVPWSLVACVGFWRVARRPASAPAERRFERFLFCWFWAGLVLFSVSTHQRGDLLFPLLPAAAVLVGRELARVTAAVRPATLFRASAVLAALVLVGLTYYDRWGSSRNPAVNETAGMAELASVLRERGGDQFPLTHVDDPFALQFYLDTARPLVSRERAAQLLRGDVPAFVAVRAEAKLRACLGPEPPALHELARWPATGDALVRILSNQSQLAPPGRVAFCAGPLLIVMDGTRLRVVRNGEMQFDCPSGHGSVSVRNDSEQPHTVRLRLPGTGRQRLETTLAPGEIWKVTH